MFAFIHDHIELLRPTIWLGFASVIDIAGGLGGRLREFSSPAEDRESVRRDWKAIEADLRGAASGR